MYRDFKGHYVKIFTDATQQPIYYGFAELITEDCVSLNPGLNEKELLAHVSKASSSKSLESVLKENGSEIELGVKRIIAMRDMWESKKSGKGSFNI